MCGIRNMDHENRTVIARWSSGSASSRLTFVWGAAGAFSLFIGYRRKIKVTSYGYPPDLETLVKGVEAQGGKKMRFLRRIPVDPMTKTTEWWLRSMQDDPDSDGADRTYLTFTPSHRVPGSTGASTRTGSCGAKSSGPSTLQGPRRWNPVLSTTHSASLICVLLPEGHVEVPGFFQVRRRTGQVENEAVADAVARGMQCPSHHRLPLRHANHNNINILRCQDSTTLRIGSKFRCIRSTPTEMQSMSENDFECFASTGVKPPDTMFPNAVERIRTTAIALKAKNPDS